MRSVLRDDAVRDRGTITAEFALAVPALLVVLLAAISAVMLAGHRVALVSAAAELARLEARGDSEAAAARLAGFGDAVRVTRSRSGPLLCLTLRSQPGRGVLAAVELSARACAAETEAGAAAEPATAELPAFATPAAGTRGPSP